MPIPKPTDRRGSETSPSNDPVSVGVAVVSTAATTTETVTRNAEEQATTTPGILPFSFYSATNASGQMLRPGIADDLSVKVPFRGSVIALCFVASASCSGTYTVWIDGVASTASLVISSGTTGSQVWVKGTYGFSSGALIDVRATSVSTSAVVEVTAYVVQDTSTIL